jgi:ABC-type sugar transport system ATPase subunit
VVGVSRSFGTVHAVKNIDLRIRQGEVLILLGENGAGKSTLVKLLAGVYPCSAGQICVDGDIEPLKPNRSREFGIRVIYQELSLIGTLNVVDNMFLGHPITRGALGAAIGWRDAKAMKTKAEAALRDLGIGLDLGAPVRNLSVAERQMVEIAKAVAFDAKIIIMDEPTTALGPAEKLRLFGLIAELKARNIGVVFVSHILEDCINIGDRFFVMRDGACVAEFPNKDITPEYLVGLIAGRPIEQRYPKIDDNPKEALALRASNVSSSKVHDCSFEVHVGEIFGFAGLVGSGRTELMRVLFGLDTMLKGSIELFGEAVKPTPERMVSGGIFFLTEDRKALGVLRNMTVGENITISALNLDCKSQTPPIRTRHGVLRSGATAPLIDRLIQVCGVKTSGASAGINSLSGGNQQKALLARALATRARLLILDEPTKGIDAAAKLEIYDLLQQLVKEGLTIVVISSELEEVMTLCSRIAIMNKGRLVRVAERRTSSADEILHTAMVA